MLIDLAAYTWHVSLCGGKSFCTNEMIYFAAFKGFPETLIFISQMGKKRGKPG